MPNIGLVPLNTKTSAVFVVKLHTLRRIGQLPVFYWAAIRLRKREKLQFSQIEGLALRENTQSILRLLSEESARADTTYAGRKLADDLKQLGRPEGRALVSRPLKLSITPWCQLIIDESRAEQLDDVDISILTNEINLSLLDQVRKFRSAK